MVKVAKVVMKELREQEASPYPMAMSGFQPLEAQEEKAAKGTQQARCLENIE